MHLVSPLRAAAPDGMSRGTRSHTAEPSPLWLVTREPLVNELVVYLDTMRQRISAAPHDRHTIAFGRSNLGEVRKAFARMICHGEARLHRACELLGDVFFDGRHSMQSVVIGEVESTRERFTLVQNISAADLYSHTDLDLGNRQVQRLRYHDGMRWSGATLVANMVEYQPEELNRWGIYKFISRIKAEEQIWNKVVDAIFGLDRIVRLDKQLRHLNRFVKDVFGIKAVVGSREGVRALHDALVALTFHPELLERHGIPVSPSTRRLECIETKDYLGAMGQKATGWRAMKSVFHWWDTTIEIQVQPLPNYHREREHLTHESHAGFKAQREELRNRVAQTFPLFGFYRDLLRWLFLSPEAPPPQFASVEIVLRD